MDQTLTPTRPPGLDNNRIDNTNNPGMMPVNLFCLQRDALSY
jgi:hypothetical protein